MPTLLEKLVQKDAIPSPPGTALEIVRLNQDENVDIDALVRVVERDPAIVAKLLKMANSSSFGRPGQVVDIRHAIMTLGLRSVNMLALSFSVVSTATGQSEIEFNYPSFWTSTAVTTTAARMLAVQYLPSAKGESFLAGLLCNFSQLVLAECAPREYGRVLRKQQKSSLPLECIERELLGTDHAQLGGDLLSRWGLPAPITDAIAIHHDEAQLNSDEAPSRDLARVLDLAGRCALIYSASELERAVQSGHSLGLLILDLDHFKSVNDTYGHQCGDEILKAVAAALQQATRGEETVCRYGGEEIAVVCPGSTAKQLEERAELLRVAVEGVSVRSGNETVSRTASIGGCWIERPKHTDLLGTDDRSSGCRALPCQGRWAQPNLHQGACADLSRGKNGHADRVALQRLSRRGRSYVAANSRSHLLPGSDSPTPSACRAAT